MAKLAEGVMANYKEKKEEVRLFLGRPAAAVWSRAE